MAKKSGTGGGGSATKKGGMLGTGSPKAAIGDGWGFGKGGKTTGHSIPPPPQGKAPSKASGNKAAALD